MINDIASSGIEKGSLICQQRQAQSKVHRVTLLQETQFLSAHSVLYLWYWLKTIEEIPTFFNTINDSDLELRRVVLYVNKGKLKARYIG
ncbi:hypothetical protein RclHR1_17990002 [Rhizophagus clarus]|uniref:Uncharacterized protein n=1 Tax=Rhizophagus clarus TaxID=94130 RepID=A0A2Z6QLG0_9GLOM|nr:hypothetical protein RclHR1_17990002 [Rhizophagus clarus]